MIERLRPNSRKTVEDNETEGCESWREKVRRANQGMPNEQIHRRPCKAGY